MQLSFEAITPAMLDSLVESFRRKAEEAHEKTRDVPKDWKQFNKTVNQCEELQGLMHALSHKAMEAEGCSEAGKAIFVPMLLGFELAMQMSQMEELQKLLN
jgi:hypothetical protein